MLPLDPGDTQPNSPLEDTHPGAAQPAGKRNFPRLLPLVVVLALILAGLLTGYGSGMGLRLSTQNNVLNGQLAEQFKLGQQAVEAGHYELAQTYYEWVLGKNPDYPGIKSAYADLLLRMQVTPSPTFTATLAASPTPDTRSQEEQFKSAQALLTAGDWNGALTSLDSLRKAAPDYQTAQVDGMYYTALYQRGFSEIRPLDDCHKTNLSAGINDFTQAEHFAPLDNTGDGLRIYARLYIAGSSFWDQDWKAASELFSQTMAGFPNMTDSSCVSATERFREATLKYAQELADNGEMCAAAEQYDAAFAINNGDNENYFPQATEAADQCHGSQSSNPENMSTAGTPSGETPTPAAETPTLTPAPPTETPTTNG